MDKVYMAEKGANFTSATGSEMMNPDWYEISLTSAACFTNFMNKFPPPKTKEEKNSCYPLYNTMFVYGICQF